jgi:lysophospholipase L1-like esterase
MIAVQRRLVVLAIIFATVAQVRSDPLSECQVRAGLPNLFAKLATTNTVRIAYLGGSITAQEGWRPKTLKWFKDQFPGAKVQQINAAIGGTGSDLGVFRLKHDVLDHDPDLLFVEFAVNDSGAPPAQIHRCMEGIVRQTWRHDPQTDVCFVYTLAGNMLDTLKQEKLPQSMMAMEQIAEHYSIPSVNMGLEVARLEKAGKLVFKGELPKTDAAKAGIGDRIVFSPDAVHPYPETGHQLYLEAVVRSMEKIRKPGTWGPHVLPAPFVSDNWESATMLLLNRAKLSPGWQRLDASKDTIAKRFGNRLPEMWKATQPGESISFRFRGTTAKIYDLLGPDCGQVILKVDDQAAVVKPRFDSFCTYHRLATLSIAEGLSNTVHQVELTIHPEQPDKAKILSQRNEKIDDPKRFDGTTWYAGAILLVGDLVEE